MNTKLKPTRYVPAMETSEGAGVTVQRSIGIPALRNFDPFMLLDQISSDNPDEYVAGFPSHPHRGFNTFTYMIDGDEGGGERERERDKERGGGWGRGRRGGARWGWGGGGGRRRRRWRGCGDGGGG